MNLLLSPHWSRLRQYRRQGQGVLAYYLTRKALRRLTSNRVELSIHQVIVLAPWRLRLPRRLAREIEVRELSPPELPVLAGLRGGETAVFASRFAAGHRCLVAFLQGRGIAYVWYVAGPAPLPTAFGCTWHIPAATVWLYDLYSDPQVLGAVGHLYGYLRHHPPGEAFSSLTGQIDFDNLRSRQAHRTLGYAEVASLWTWRCGGWQWHCESSRSRRRWHFGHATVALDRYLPAAGWKTAMHTAPTAAPETDATVFLPPQLQCLCGRAVALAARELQCRCGRRLGEWREGALVTGPPIPYWGEIPRAAMEELLCQAENEGCLAAARRLLPAELQEYALGPARAAFQDVVPLRPGARILDVGAGWGGIACQLARHYDVVALEGVWERARFMALRGRQEGLHRLTVINGEVNSAPLQPRQFDAIVANGILEWAAMLDASAPPREIQLRFLRRLRGLLAPGGVIYLGIENRCGWNELRGARDHSGLPYTSLLPRPLARWVCAHSRSYRSQFNLGYRTYTYTHRGYAKLFAEARLDLAASWICPAGYNHPEEMVPLHTAAIRFAQRARGPAAQGRGRVKDRLRLWLGRDWVWRWIGADFAFLLGPAAEAVQFDQSWQAPPPDTELAGGAAGHDGGRAHA